MAGFDADEAVEALDVRGLSKYGIDNFTIPEPTSRQLRLYARGLQRLGLGDREVGEAKYAEAAKAARAELEKRCKAEKRKPTPEEIDEAIDGAAAELNRSTFALVVELCGEPLTVETLERVPIRLFNAFFWWLWTEIMDPTVSSPATRPSLTALQGGKSAS
jgi:hypothetical protein